MFSGRVMRDDGNMQWRWVCSLRRSGFL